jgi:transposase|tara:strand:+ start:64 stop:1086 length:1023 start_codon:yes stop_codon:yes gene_type:complete
MNQLLSSSEETRLRSQHRLEKNRRKADRLKAVLLSNKGWSHLRIAEALFLDDETVARHIKEYKETQKLSLDSGGSSSKLTVEQSSELTTHLMEEVYVKVADVCVYVLSKYGVFYTVSGMRSWLQSHKFSYKKPKGTPAKADPEAQAKWIETYEKLMNTLPEDEPIEFGDGVHPTMTTKVTYGWIRTGTDKPILTTGNRTRMNLMGSINLESMEVTIGDYERLNSEAMRSHFSCLRDKYPTATSIHLILDQGSYNTSAETKKSAEEMGIVLHYLPPYSPNLNPIERLWKVMNEYVRNNRFFHSAKEFRRSILDFFEKTWPKIAPNMTDRINDNFQRLKSAL